jgi:hypothetical protein
MDGLSDDGRVMIGRMNLHMNGGTTGIRTPSNEEFQTILAYMQKRAR